jgi:DNA mismatch repair protein MutS
MYGGIIGIMKRDSFTVKDTFVDLAKERFSPTDFIESLERDYSKLKDKSFNEKRPWVRPALYAFFARGCYQFLRYDVWNTINDSMEKYETTNKIHKKMNAIASYISATKAIGDLLSKNKVLMENLHCIQFMQNPKRSEGRHFSQEYQEILTMLETKTFDGQPSFWANKGKALAAFKMMQDSKNDFIKILKTTGKLDALMSIAKLYKKHINEKANYCFTQYKKATSPYMSIKGFWSPFISPSCAMVNDVEFGGSSTQNMIVTGPNAGGKSTIIRGITICVLLALTLGIAPAQEMVITPFSKVSTYLNISDVAGKESCFQSEMKHALILVNSITSLKSNEFGYAVIDELFKGTNPLEGIAGSYAIAKRLISIPNSICLFATHFKKLTELEDKTQTVTNYKVLANKNPDGSFSYPFKLYKGPSDQTIALDLLKHQGFDPIILNDAQQIVSELQKK